MMKNVLIFFPLVVATALAQAPSCNLKSEAEIAADKQKVFAQLLQSSQDQAAIRYNLAVDYAEVGNGAKALSWLEQALTDTPWLDASTDPSLRSLRGCAAFQKLVRRVHARYPQRSSSRVVRVVPQKDLIPEGLAADPVDGTMYLSSIFHRKIVRIVPDRRVSDFVREAQDGLLGVLGIKVDPRDRSVWAASERGGESALVHFDRSGRTIARYAPQEAGKHLFNDLVVTSEGDVYVTDSEDASIYKFAHDGNKPVRIDLGKRFYPNGIALSGDEKLLYVAHAFGIVVMDLDRGSIAEMPAARGVSISAADGLYYRSGTLIAIQNGVGANRIVELRLAPDGRSVTSGRLLEFRSRNLELPTTGAIYKNNFYYIVNSQIDHEENGKLNRESELQPVKIAKLALR